MIVHFLTFNDLWLVTNGQKINVFLLKMLTLFQGGNFRFKNKQILIGNFPAKRK